jgi:adenine-specific DNA methylase
MGYQSVGDVIKDVVDEIDPDKNGVCDLFSGAGSVNQLLSSERKIVSIDIQNYSNIICNALLKPVSDEFIDSFISNIKNSKLIDEYLNIFSPIIEFEENLINGKLTPDLELVCNFLENSSLYSVITEEPDNASKLLKQA